MAVGGHGNSAAARERSMTKRILKLGAAAVLAVCALAGGAWAGSLDDRDGYGKDRETYGTFCERYPDHSRCVPDGPRHKPNKAAYYGQVCGPTVRAAGKRNLFPAFARNSALFAWRREVRAVHGGEYASWSLARRPAISCGPAGGALTGCVATAIPCRA
jgi:hypothetical protein